MVLGTEMMTGLRAVATPVPLGLTATTVVEGATVSALDNEIGADSAYTGMAPFVSGVVISDDSVRETESFILSVDVCKRCQIQKALVESFNDLAYLSIER